MGGLVVFFSASALLSLASLLCVRFRVFLPVAVSALRLLTPSLFVCGPWQQCSARPFCAHRVLVTLTFFRDNVQRESLVGIPQTVSESVGHVSFLGFVSHACRRSSLAAQLAVVFCLCVLCASRNEPRPAARLSRRAGPLRLRFSCLIRTVMRVFRATRM